MKPLLFGADSWTVLHTLSLIVDNQRVKLDSNMHDMVVLFVTIFPELVQCVYCRYPATEFHKFLEGVGDIEPEYRKVIASLGGTPQLSVSQAAATGRLFERSVLLHNMVTRKILMTDTSSTKRIYEVGEAKVLWAAILKSNVASVERSLWSYVTMVVVHYNDHGVEHKRDLYQRFLQSVPAVITLIMGKPVKTVTTTSALCQKAFANVPAESEHLASALRLFAKQVTAFSQYPICPITKYIDEALRRHRQHTGSQKGKSVGGNEKK